MCQTRANHRVKAIAKAGYLINIRPALAACLIEGSFKLGNIDRERVIALAKGI